MAPFISSEGLHHLRSRLELELVIHDLPLLGRRERSTGRMDGVVGTGSGPDLGQVGVPCRTTALGQIVGVPRTTATEQRNHGGCRDGGTTIRRFMAATVRGATPLCHACSMTEAPERTKAISLLRRHTGEDADVITRAPGRVNLIGEHTDYNDGFVLPMALPHATWMAARRRHDGVIRLWSEGHPPAELSTAGLDERVDGWSVYVQGVARMLADGGMEVRGFDAALTTDIPIGASLSSSAALELVTARVITAFAGERWDPVAGALASVAGGTRACRDALWRDGPADLLGRRPRATPR